MLVEDGRLTFRAVLVGDSSVGKTSILNRFIYSRFDPCEPNTVGALYETYTQSRLGKEVEVQMWDTAGTEQYRSLTPVYFRQAAAAVIVYDITSPSSFASLETWLTMFREICTGRSLVVVVANKQDLADRRLVGPDEGREWAAKRTCLYAETSAQTGAGVADLFTELLDALVEQSDACAETPKAVGLADADGPAGTASCC